MHRTVARAALAIIVTAWLAACTPDGPTPTVVDQAATPPPATTGASSSATPAAVFEPGDATLKVTGVLFEPCIPPPSGCAYDVTILGQDGAQVAVTLDYPADYSAQSAGTRTPMRPKPGLPATLAPGDHVAVFQSFEWSDSASPVPLASGGTGYLPVVREGCRKAFTVIPKTTAIRLKVTWHSITCTVKLTKA